MCRHTHDGSGTVICQYIVREPDRHFRTVQRIDGIGSCEHTCLLLVLHTVHVGLHGSLIDVFVHSLLVLRCGKGSRQSMLRSQHHEGGAVERVGAGGVDGDLLVSSLHREVHLGAIGFADPVCLHLLDLLRPVQLVQIVQETLRVGCDLQHPLAEVLLCHLCTAALAFSVDNLLVGKACLTGGAPVDGELLLIGKSRLEHLHKDPLGPLVIVRVCRIDLQVPVVESRNLVDLLLDVPDILLRGLCRVHAHLDGIVLSRKPEGIPSHGMDDIIALQQLVSAPDIGNHIPSPMSHMKPVSGRIWEHIQAVILLSFIAVLIYFGIHRVLLPVFPPFFLDRLMIIRYSHCSFLLKIA